MPGRLSLRPDQVMPPSPRRPLAFHQGGEGPFSSPLRPGWLEWFRMFSYNTIVVFEALEERTKQHDQGVDIG